MIQYFRRHVKKYSSVFILFIFLSIVTYSIELILPYTLSQFIDKIILYKSKDIIRIFGTIICALTLIFLVFTFYKELIFKKYADKIRYDMLDECESHIEMLPLKEINKFNPAYLNQRLNDDILNIILFIFNNLSNSIMQIISVIALGIIILTINIKIFFILVVMIVLNSIGYVYYNKELFKKGYSYRDAHNEFYAANNDRLSMVKQTKMNSWFDIVKARVSESFNTQLRKNIDFIKVSTKLQNVGNASKYISIVLLIIFGGKEIINDNITIGQFILVYNYANLCISNMESFLSLGQNYQHAKVCYSRMLEILNLEQEHNGSKIIDDIDSVEVKELSFQYHDERQLYSDLNLFFQKGKVYCIKGENGSGKSSLIDIITGLRYDYTGEVLYNNEPLQNLDAHYIRKNLIAVVEQEPDVINIPLNQNLTFGIQSYDSNRLEKLCSELSIDKRVSSKCDDINLSGGEKQKICEIRALLKNPRMMILDEPISALDSRSIVKLKEILSEEKKDKIILLITHNEEIEDIVDEIITL